MTKRTFINKGISPYTHAIAWSICLFISFAGISQGNRQGIFFLLIGVIGMTILSALLLYDKRTAVETGDGKFVFYQSNWRFGTLYKVILANMTYGFKIDKKMISSRGDNSIYQINFTNEQGASVILEHYHHTDQSPGLNERIQFWDTLIRGNQ